MSQTIALKFGSFFTSVFVSGSGFVLKEPTRAAFLGEVEPKNLKAVGYDALEMIGRTPEKMRIIEPIVGGAVADKQAAVILLSEFLRRVRAKSFIPKRFKALLCVPCGLNAQDRKNLAEVCYLCGIKDLTIIESIISAAVGVDLPISSGSALVVNIGGGLCDIAAISHAGVVAGCSINVGGNVLDEALIRHINDKYSVQIGWQTACLVKDEIGTLYPNDMASMNISGTDLRTKNPISITLRAGDAYAAYAHYFSSIADAIESIVNSCPPEIASDIYKNGISVTGGVSKFSGLDRFLRNQLRLPVNLFEDGADAVILGAGRLLSNKALLDAVLAQA